MPVTNHPRRSPRAGKRRYNASCEACRKRKRSDASRGESTVSTTEFIKQHDGEELESSIIFTKRPPKKGKTASTKKMSEEMAVASEPETAAASEETAVVSEHVEDPVDILNVIAMLQQAAARDSSMKEAVVLSTLTMVMRAIEQKVPGMLTVAMRMLEAAARYSSSTLPTPPMHVTPGSNTPHLVTTPTSEETVLANKDACSYGVVPTVIHANQRQPTVEQEVQEISIPDIWNLWEEWPSSPSKSMDQHEAGYGGGVGGVGYGRALWHNITSANWRARLVNVKDYGNARYRAPSAIVMRDYNHANRGEEIDEKGDGEEGEERNGKQSVMNRTKWEEMYEVRRPKKGRSETNERKGKRSEMKRNQDRDRTSVRLSVTETRVYARNFYHKGQEKAKKNISDTLTINLNQETSPIDPK
ncbi:uncharacterized protein STEHIDRAFT_116243 [Stereum hirsutum FP-91666 SS1]|uniref:Uncharacterized protein n=1 Tax=Stereum hirsutum (strain FP-91666) TaxID=721885 RepID=R7RWR0_STEHR|nr:uncharacterized protein STEHIDRAFT_116243 [Stereum hirsutum FP-91666 SS1]EIM79754.1 hypothetical protein STEHIDRAFT_116243 [Stereum hirsutum FP-91666 SS1]